MNIVFKTVKLRKIFCCEKELVREYGKKNTSKITKRISYFRNVSNLSQVPVDVPFRRHLLKGNYEGCFSVDLKQPYRLIFRPANNPLPMLDNGGVDLKRVTSIEIIGVEDYH